MATNLEDEERKLEEAAKKAPKKQELKLQEEPQLPEEAEVEEGLQLWEERKKPNRFKHYLVKVVIPKLKKQKESRRERKTKELLERDRKKIIFLALEELRIIGQLLKYLGKGGNIDVADQGIQMQLGAKLDAASPQVRELIGLVEYLKHKREDRKVEAIKHRIDDALAAIQTARLHANHEPVRVDMGNTLEKARKMMAAEEQGVNRSEAKPKDSLEPKRQESNLENITRPEKRGRLSPPLQKERPIEAPIPKPLAKKDKVAGIENQHENKQDERNNRNR